MTRKISAGLAKRIKAVKLLILDVDGVMTDGGIIYDDDGRELKVFDVKDGHGIKLLMRAGIGVAIITGRESKVVYHRAKNLGIDIDMVYQGAKDKLKAFEDILKNRQLSLEEDVKKHVDYVTVKNGGSGAVRELCELILKVQGKWDTVTAAYFSG